MSYGNSVLTPTFKLSPARPKISQPFNTSSILAHAYTVFATSFAIVLICLALRVIFALFIVEGPLAHAINTLTTPVITPFGNIFHDSQTMVQVSTMTAFSAYYIVYGITGKLLALYRRRLTA